MNNYRVSAIIPAAGQGKRMNKDISKQYIEVNNNPILYYTLKKFENSSYIDEIILVVGKDDIDYVKDNIIKKYKFTKIKKVISGGTERQDSVFKGLKLVDEKTDIVLIHDGARPLISEKDISKIVENTIKYDACILGVKVKDTIKIANENCEVINTPNRNKLFAIQTPQSFKKDLILSAYEKGMEKGIIATDDSMLVEEFTNTNVKIIEGNYKNIKITTPEDLEIFKLLLEK